MTKNNGARWANSLWRVAADHYGDRLHRFLLRRLGRQEADDVAQDIYMQLLLVPHDEFIRNPEAYIYTVARGMVANFHRRTNRQRAIILTDSDKVEQLSEHPEELPPDELAQSVSCSQFLNLFLRTLPPVQAKALLMFEHDGYSYVEIAKELHLSRRAVERYLTKAREKFHRLLQSELDAEAKSQGNREEDTL
jgi:RNA polymerase sigma factor (sigma-70 family)